MKMIVSHDSSLKIEEPELYQLYWNFEKLEVQTFISSTIFFPEISCNFRIHFLYSVEQLTRARVRYHAEKKNIYICIDTIYYEKLGVLLQFKFNLFRKSSILRVKFILKTI